MGTFHFINDALIYSDTTEGMSLKFSLDFTVLYRQQKPVIQFNKVPDARYNMPSWHMGGAEEVIDDDFLPHEWETDELISDAYTFNYFKSGEKTTVSPVKIHKEKNFLECEYEQHERFILSAKVIMHEKEPVITFSLTPKVDGWFSIGYVGAPAVDVEDVEAIWQPMVWRDRCFPKDSYLTLESNCPVPSTLVTKEGITYGVVVEPSMMKYRMPNAHNSEFGVMVRNEKALTQPTVFAPVLGGENSFMTSGTKFDFSVKLLARQENRVGTFEYIAREIYGFKDCRKNVSCSLTETMHNMVDYGMNHYYGNWNEALKGCSYHTDVPGSVKNVSALHMLGMAYITDNPAILEKRAVPSAEYLLSREKLLFASNENVKGQGASHYLNGPCVTVSELASLHSMFYGQSPVFKLEALKQFERQVSDTGFNAVGRSSQYGCTWQNALAVYRMSNDEKYLKDAVELAKEYIDEVVNKEISEIEDYSEFWTDYVPRFAELTELYEETGDKIFLDAAYRSAKDYCSFIWYSPMIPDGDITVNKGGTTSKYWYARGPEAMRISEEQVPAWQVSEIGLNCEASTTGHGHRAIFMALYAPYFMRLAGYTGDKFLQDTARSAIVGRYSNFPGYHMNTQRSTVYEKYDYPYHEFEELTYNTFHYNHIWPHISMLMDYLIAEVSCMSKGKIHFPSQYSECFVYMTSRVYGDRPGKIYDEDNLWLWMPKDILKIGSSQLNYITARGSDKLYVVLTNQSESPVDTNIYLNAEIVPFEQEEKNKVRVWQQNKETENLMMKSGIVPVHVEPKGITVISVDGISADSKIDRLIPDKAQKVQHNVKSTSSTVTPFGRLEAMIMSLGHEYINNLYIWLAATEKDFKEVRLYCYIEGEMHTFVDQSYPFEFTVDLKRNRGVSFWLEGLSADGHIVRTDMTQLGIGSVYCKDVMKSTCGKSGE